MKTLLVFIALLCIAFYFWLKYNSKWEELLTTQDVEKYMSIVEIGRASCRERV